MNYFEEGVRTKVRFNTTKGLLSMEELYDMKRTPLGRIVRALKKELDKTNTSEDGLDFLDDTTTTKPDSTLVLQFEIAKAIYLTKKDEALEAAMEADKKAHNAKIIAEMAKRKEKQYETMSDEELEKALMD